MNIYKLCLLQTKDENIDFDVDVAIKVCRQSSPDNALALAEKHCRHSLYVKILLEDSQKYSVALEYIEKLSIEQVLSYCYNHNHYTISLYVH